MLREFKLIAQGCNPGSDFSRVQIHVCLMPQIKLLNINVSLNRSHSNRRKKNNTSKYDPNGPMTEAQKFYFGICNLQRNNEK